MNWASLLPLLGVAIGSLLSIVATKIAERNRYERELRHRWDAEILKAVGAYIEAVQGAISALYDEGRSRASSDSTALDSADTIKANRRSREAMDRVRTTVVIARLHAPSLREPIETYKKELDQLKAHADKGFATDASLWPTSKKRLQFALDHLEDATTELLKMK
jgi:hypothetical protein